LIEVIGPPFLVKKCQILVKCWGTMFRCFERPQNGKLCKLTMFPMLRYVIKSMLIVCLNSFSPFLTRPLLLLKVKDSAESFSVLIANDTQIDQITKVKKHIISVFHCKSDLLHCSEYLHLLKLLDKRNTRVIIVHIYMVVLGRQGLSIIFRIVF
jgi:hypothetical protein